MHAVAVRAVVFALTLGAAACGETDITGTWSGVGNGTGTVGTGSLAMTMKLEEKDDAVTGTGTASGRGGRIAFEVSGSAKDDDVDLTIMATGASVAGRYHAKLEDDDTMAGTYTDPVFTAPLTLKRE